MSDKPMRFFASEIIREEIFLRTNQEASTMHSTMQLYAYWWLCVFIQLFILPYFPRPSSSAACILHCNV